MGKLSYYYIAENVIHKANPKGGIENTIKQVQQNTLSITINVAIVEIYN